MPLNTPLTSNIEPVMNYVKVVYLFQEVAFVLFGYVTI
ncbi:hypothetical protein HMPREF1565_0064 [Providencia alcalifaciens RIMD 1656011]|uniref:Uncharacterized protein n=1 Tax=Providencia alcalifaciens 205/92 TaxID=1256988 RepID=A0AAV3M4P4_9GAMM|nr:hypothetical protein HMPREF1565_0064 [Providencia alcalifaciens RIMD 1656011]EUD10786.1 hypothetical protein HMPREF1563_0191 [Providencia alcalifaciens 205/92]